MSEDPFLSRWSRLKKAAKMTAAGGDIAPAAEAPAAAPVTPPKAPGPADAPQDAERAAAPLPPVESLTPESDFSPFMRSKVEDSVRRRALKTLFHDPRFNVMDGLDVYIDDYSKADPLPDGWLEKMSQMAHLGDQPARLEEERRAAEAAQADGAPAAGTNSIAGERPATAADAPPSDTSDHVDEAPAVRVSEERGPSLS